MKIYYVAPFRTTFPSMAASSIHMIKMCEAYSNLGHDVCFVISDNEFSDADIKNYYGIKSDFEIKRIKSSKSKVGNVSYAIKSAFYINNRKPSVCVGRSITSLSLLCFLRNKVTIDIHGPVWEFNKLDFFLFKKVVKCRWLNKITVNSYALKKMYLDKGLIDEDRIIVAHNGSDSFENKENKEIKNIVYNDNLNVGYFGGLYKGRGVDLILDIAKDLKYFNFHFFGGSKEEINRLDTDLKNVYFHGHVPHSDVAYYRSQCDILLAPYSSIGVAVAGGSGDSSKYMNPIKIVEYMSSGKAIVTSDLPVLKEVLDDDSAVFAKPDNKNSWLSALVKLKNDKLRVKIGDNALEKFEQGLTWESRANKLL